MWVQLPPPAPTFRQCLCVFEGCAEVSVPCARPSIVFEVSNPQWTRRASRTRRFESWAVYEVRVHAAMGGEQIKTEACAGSDRNITQLSFRLESKQGPIDRAAHQAKGRSRYSTDCPGGSSLHPSDGQPTSESGNFLRDSDEAREIFLPSDAEALWHIHAGFPWVECGESQIR